MAGAGHVLRDGLVPHVGHPFGQILQQFEPHAGVVAVHHLQHRRENPEVGHPGPLAEAVDAALQNLRAALERRQLSCGAELEVVVAVDRQRDFGAEDLLDHPGVVLVHGGDACAADVVDPQAVDAGFLQPRHDGLQAVEVQPREVHQVRVHVGALLFAVLDGLAGAVEGLLAGDREPAHRLDELVVVIGDGERWADDVGTRVEAEVDLLAARPGVERGRRVNERLDAELDAHRLCPLDLVDEVVVHLDDVHADFVYATGEFEYFIDAHRDAGDLPALA